MSQNQDDFNISVEKWNNLIQDIHVAVVGDIHGKVGLLTQVKELQGQFIIIIDRLKNFDSFIKKAETVEDLVRNRQLTIDSITELKNRLVIVESILAEIKPETEDTKKKKWLIIGGIAVIGVIAGIVKFIFPFLKGIPKP